ASRSPRPASVLVCIACTAWNDAFGQGFNVCTNVARASDPYFALLCEHMLQHFPELSQTMWLPQDEAMQHDTHDQRTARGLLQQFVKLIDQTCTVRLGWRST